MPPANPLSIRQTGPSRCIVILGMHRSGTSMLAGSLEEAGLYLGGVLRHRNPATHPKGLLEPAAVLHMHENLLQANGGSWDAPPATLDWSRMHLAIRDHFIESRAHVPLWGFKDPRTLITFQGWADVLPDWTAAGIFRHPAEVVRSLHSRNGFDLDKGFALWTAYNARLLALQETHGFPVMEFSPDTERTRQSIAGMAAQLGLRDDGEQGFYDRTMRKFDAENIHPPREVMTLYEALRDRSL